MREQMERPKNKLLDSSEAVLVVVDVQEAFRSAIPDFALIVSRIAIAVQGFAILGTPIVVTEQYPKGLGKTAEELLFALPETAEFIEKSTFSAHGDASFIEKLEQFGRKQVALCGIEAHVCVNQTAHDLIQMGFEVHLLTDCVASRYEHDKHAALKKIHDSGAISSSMEMALFEMMRDSKHEKFKEIQALIK